MNENCSDNETCVLVKDWARCQCIPGCERVGPKCLKCQEGFYSPLGENESCSDAVKFSCKAEDLHLIFVIDKSGSVIRSSNDEKRMALFIHNVLKNEIFQSRRTISIVAYATTAKVILDRVRWSDVHFPDLRSYGLEYESNVTKGLELAHTLPTENSMVVFISNGVVALSGYVAVLFFSVCLSLFSCYFAVLGWFL